MTAWAQRLPPPAQNNLYGFTGRYLDEEAGLWYFRARYFDDEQGRFISRDPLGYVDGMNLYNGYFAESFGLDPYGQHEIDPETGAWIDERGKPTREVSIAIGAHDTSLARAVKRGDIKEGLDAYVSILKEGATGSDFFKAIKSKYNSNCECVKTLIISSHGSQRDLDIGGDSKDVGSIMRRTVKKPGKSNFEINPIGRKFDKMNSIDRFNALIFGRELKKNIGFCLNCVIIVAACDAGTYKYMQQTMQHLASGTGCTVYAAKYGCWSGNLDIKKPFQSIEVSSEDGSTDHTTKKMWKKYTPATGEKVPVMPERYK